MTTSIPRLLRSGALWFAACQAAALSVLLWTASTPGFRGGGFVRAVLTAAVALQLVVLVAEARRALAPTGTAEPSSTGEPWHLVGTGLHLVLLLLLTYVAGAYVGAFGFLFGYWYVGCGRPLTTALGLAVLFGFGLPLILTNLVAVPLWTGVAPSVWPGVIGGSIRPPF